MEIREYKTYNESEILRLYTSVGWTAYTDQPEVLRKGFEGSMTDLAAYEAISFLASFAPWAIGIPVVFVQDILVFPEHQRKGFGSALLQAVLNRYSHVRQIELATDSHAENHCFLQVNGIL